MAKHEFIENNIIILSKQTIDSFLSQDKKIRADLFALYSFYYYTAKWQKTNQPRATINYVAKGLGWGETKTRDRKQALIKLGLIEDVRDIDQKSKKVKGWYVKVKYVWKEENHPHDSPQGGLSHRVEKTNPNALSDSSLNALNDNKKSAEASSADFCQEELKKLKDSKRQDLQVIALYWEHKKIKLDNRAKFQSALKRELRSANLLKGYSSEEIKKTMKYLDSVDYISKWTLETVHKYIDDVESLKVKKPKHINYNNG